MCSARNWWLRSPNPNNANNERNVNTSGAVNNNNANNSNGVVPDCGESEIQVGASPKQSTPRRERLSRLEGGKETGDAGGIRAVPAVSVRTSWKTTTKRRFRSMLCTKV